MEKSRIKFIEHDLKEILLLDFSNSNPDEVLKTIDYAKDVIRTRPEKSLLTLTDVTNARFNDKVSEGMKEFAHHNKPYVRAGAVVGVTGLQKIIFRAVMAFSKRKFEAFDDREKAAVWLINN